MRHTFKTWSRRTLATFLLGAGVAHFVAIDFFIRVVPPYLPEPQTLVIVSGVAEIVIGMGLLLRQTAKVAAWLAIALLLAVFPANIYVYQNQHLFPLPAWMHLLRLPFQGVFIAWAYWHTSPETGTANDDKS